ncbi:1-(5-phosphoribosyl)-5-[(5-phosphoribosylamino)methylideneamino]imidazole-4-carboxamide isomerase [Virgibacillus sp. 179-BFC.A HS]|uniref:1-(5-phosphoribosyl)-5-[(5-phosphoribosylamino)methylideneamino] imidazole-4-carboxamide isomerase n=1 Tax=Tigheibacillus jepli TaxID=3035914 RepID=A0ABU5CKC8_9BACI|nr:1-(5-phosphoribosyl)-5-[(5-phosphoribosylamino)methylideneamino]imidazole-4-carboxamide isomerase [Virgibacillus sp. 179-BFC.A HS]MDY0406817.1 1-(5-phosphoribosyl)-5-[(5-phosphoribosylamino)methylideneamino]imidazole-4-carboxamide isomerase [Virgibacillus sp. 179-BFC.A HS]
MIIFPAIDIRNGNCVRLTQGDYNQEKIYSDSPITMAEKWASLGASWIHIVDLDGAKTGLSKNAEVIKQIAKNSSVPVQVGGGIRSINVVRDYLDSGVSRVIIGTAAINDREFLREAVVAYGEKIAVSIDARNGFVATDGWTDTSEIKALDLLEQLADIGVKTVVYTDILKDGMLKGPNFAELDAVNQAANVQVIASGGVSTIADIEKLSAMNMYGTIVGKALYDGKLSLETVLEVAQ